jgi:RNA polymerase sigma-70 factor (ECF subfamily)
VAPDLRIAHERWPEIALDDAAFHARFSVAPAFVCDAFLAAACAARDEAAIRALDAELLAQVPAMVRRIDSDPAFGAEIAQRVRVRLLVGDGDSPARIALYTGEVPLAAWVRVIAVRLALNAKRPPAGERRASEAPPPDGPTDPEIDYLRAAYREPFARAFEEALATLPKDDRTVLRMHYVDGVNIDGIGTVFGVHRATVARWLVRIRSDVLARAKDLLAARLGAEIEEAESVIGVLAGEIDVTLSRVLGRSA